jgi:hypothetical protein
MTAFPGTPLYSRLKSEGRLIDEVGWEKCTLFDVNVRPDRMSIEELERGLIELGRLLYSAEAKQARLKAFKQQIRYGGRQRRRSEVWRSEQQARDQQH